MIIYNRAYDLYYTVFRLLQYLNRIEEGELLEVERLMIWDFYLLFPKEVSTIRLKRGETEIKKAIKYINTGLNNPYEEIGNARKIFEKIKPYQKAALNCIASYGIIDKSLLLQQRVLIINKEVLNVFFGKYTEGSPETNNIISIMTQYFHRISLYGTDGLKSRTNLIESKYDA